MNRRTYLSGVMIGVSSLVGCTATGRDSATVPDRTLSDASASTPEGDDLSIEPTVERRRIDSERTARIELTVTWQGREPQGLSFGNRIPFSSPNYSSDRSGLVLLPADSGIERQSEQTWVPETYSDGTIASNSNLVLGEFEPGDSTSGTWEVWADPQEASRIEPGSYRFDNQIGRYSDLSSDDSGQLDWSLFLEITEA